MGEQLVSGLDARCPACDRVSGDHTLREWAVCLGTTTTDLPYEPTPADTAADANDAMTAQLREQLGVPDGWLIADNIIVKALVLDAGSGPVGVKIPLVLHEFSVAGPAGLTDVATIAFIGPPAVVRKYGRLVKDSANGAANAAERG
jgi:hypothetical protein